VYGTITTRGIARNFLVRRLRRKVTVTGHPVLRGLGAFPHRNFV